MKTLLEFDARCKFVSKYMCFFLLDFAEFLLQSYLIGRKIKLPLGTHDEIQEYQLNGSLCVREGTGHKVGNIGQLPLESPTSMRVQRSLYRLIGPLRYKAGLIDGRTQSIVCSSQSSKFSARTNDLSASSRSNDLVTGMAIATSVVTCLSVSTIWNVHRLNASNLTSLRNLNLLLVSGDSKLRSLCYVRLNHYKVP